MVRLAAAFAVLVLAGCSPADERSATDAGDAGQPCLFCSDATDDAPLAVQVRGTIDQICASVDGCHGQAAGGMALTPGGGEFDAMINVSSQEEPWLKRVLPGDPEHSYVFLKLACEGGIDGGCMPASSGFNPAIAHTFHDWIEAGAPLP